MVAEGVPLATQALLNADGDAFTTLAARDQAIDALYVEVEGLANREIVLQAPVASDLRFLLTVLRVVPELERSHDLVMNIAERVLVMDHGVICEAGAVDTVLKAPEHEYTRRLLDAAPCLPETAVGAALATSTSGSASPRG